MFNRFFMLLLVMNAAHSVYGQNGPSSFATATADNLQAIINEYSTLTGEHFAFIYNDTSTINLYSYYFELCAPNNGCNRKTYTVTIYPHSAFNVYGASTLNAIFISPGSYTITASTGISGININSVTSGTNVARIITP